MSEGSAPEAGRPMKYPYTYSAKLAQFPYKLYFGHRYFKLYVISVGLTLPLFYKIHKLVNSPENISAYEKVKAREAAEHAAHGH